MNPSDIVQDMINTIKNTISSLSDSDKDVKVFTAEKHYNTMLQLATALKTAIDVGTYELSIVDIEGKEEVVEGMTLKQTELENLYVIQPVKYCDSEEHAELLEGLSQACDKGALNNKPVLVLPYDIRVLKAKLEK